MNDWPAYFKDLGDKTAGATALELKDLIASCVVDGAKDVCERALALDRILDQIAAGEIEPADFKMYLQDWEDLARMRMIEQEVRGKAAMQRLIDGVQEHLINGLGKLL